MSAPRVRSPGEALPPAPLAAPARAQVVWALAALCVVWVAECAACWPYTMDDAYISLRYATHLAHGQGLSWNPGGPPVEGFSNILWVLWMAGASLVADPMAATKTLGAIAGFAAVILLAREGREILPGGWGLFPSACLAASPMFAFWSVSGIEAPAACLALLAGWRGIRTGDVRYAASGFGALALLRPEGLPLAILALGAGVVWGTSAIRRRLLLSAGCVAAIVAPWLVWRLARFGSPVANTVAAKWMPFGGLRYFLGDFVVLAGAHAALAVAAVVILVRTRGRGDRSRAALLIGAALVAAQAVALLNTRPAMGFYLRLFWPVLPLLFLLSGAALAELQRRIRTGWLVTVPAAVLLVFPLLRDLGPVRLPGAPAGAPVRRTAVAVGEILGTVHGPLADWVRETHPGATVALTDCGLLPWRSEATIIDLWGLNDTDIAHNGFDAGRVLARRPDLLVLASKSATEFRPRFPMDGALQAHPDVAVRYRRVKTFTWANRVDASGDYSLWVFERVS